MYHPPSTDDHLMLNYILESLTCIEAQFPNSGVIIAGDFNKIKYFSTPKCFQPNIPDIILNNLDQCYQEPETFPPFGLSDHVSIVIKPCARSEVPKVTFKVKYRDTSPSKRFAFRQYLEQVNIQSLSNEKEFCEDQVTTFESIIKYGLDTLPPVRSKIKFVNDPPWISKKLKNLFSNVRNP